MRISKSFSVLCSYGMISNLKLSSTDIRIYLYLKFRWQFFHSKGSEFCESTTTISEEVGVYGKIRRVGIPGSSQPTRKNQPVYHQR